MPSNTLSHCLPLPIHGSSWAICVLFGVVGLLCCACGDAQQPSQVYLAQIDSTGKVDTLAQALVARGIGLEEVRAYIRSHPLSASREAQLIEAAYWRVGNYLQTDNPEYWLAVLFRLDKFMEILHTFKAAHHRSFVDVGAGNGEKPYAALCAGFEKVYALEYSDSLVQRSRRGLAAFISRREAEVIHADALQIPATFYTGIDFIYLYSPIKDAQMMAQLSAKILRAMREGSIFAEMRFVYRRELEALLGLALPDQADLVLRKSGNVYYVAHYGLGKLEWIALSKHPTLR